MTDASIDLDALQRGYKQAVNDWIVAIREEEGLASVAHDIAEIDMWEAAAFRQDEQRLVVMAAKHAYEDGLRRFHFKF